MRRAGPSLSPLTAPHALDRRPPLAYAAGAVIALQAAALAVLWPSISGANDYVQLLSGGRALLAGVDLYDPASWSTRPLAIEQMPPSPIFTYPPWVALFFAPFAPLPVAVGSLVWAAGGLALAAGGTVAVARRWSWPVGPCVLLACASWPALLVFLQGQWGYALYALACACLLAIDRGRDGRAGILWGLAVLAKPQLFVAGSIVLAVWSLLARRPRVLLAAIATALAGIALGTAVQPRWVAPYVSLVLGPHVRSTQQPTLAGLAGDVAGERWVLAWAALVVALAGAIVVALRSVPPGQRLPLAFAGTLALSQVSALYSWSYDQYLALLLGAATLGLAWRRTGGRAIAAAIAILFGPLAFALFESAYVRWHDTLAGLVPVIAILLAWAAARHQSAREPV